MDGYDFKSPTDEKFHLWTLSKPWKCIKGKHFPITIVAIGPLTNIALLLATYPEIKSKIKQIVIMGGSSGRGNVTPLAEFNIYCDPEAANIVLTLNFLWLWLIRFSTSSHVFPWIYRKIKATNQTGDMLSQLFQHYRTENVHEGLKLYDVFTILYLIDADLFNVFDANVQIELQGILTKGNCCRL